MGFEKVDTVLSSSPFISPDISQSFSRLSPELAHNIEFHTMEAVPLGLGRAIRLLSRRCNDLFTTILILTLGLTFWRHRQKHPKALKALMIFIPAALCWCGISLTCAMVHSLEVNRYLDIQLPATAFTLARALVTVIGLAFPGGHLQTKSTKLPDETLHAEAF